MSLELGQWQRETAAVLLRDGDDDFAVYRNNVRGGLVETLATAFPVTRRIVGAAAFAGVADAFVCAAPPRVPHLSAYGAGLADFIAGHEIGGQLPYLSDVARLEWARAESYFAADAPSMDPARLAALSPEGMAAAVLALHPAARLVPSRYPIHRIWEVNQLDNVPGVDMSVAETVLVTRPGMAIAMRKICAADAALVQAAERSLDEAADAAMAVDAGFNLQAALAAHFTGATFRG